MPRRYLWAASGAARSPTTQRGNGMIEFGGLPNDQRGFVHRRLFGGAKGFLTGGPAGAVGGFLAATRRPGSMLSGTPGHPRSFGGPTNGARHTFPSLSVQRVPGLRGVAQRLVPGGATGFQVPIQTGNGCQSGYHPNKSNYYTQAGFVAEGTKCVKNRRRNLSNGRANTRSLRRLAAWDKQERKLAKTMKSIARGR